MNGPYGSFEICNYTDNVSRSKKSLKSLFAQPKYWRLMKAGKRKKVAMHIKSWWKEYKKSFSKYILFEK